VTRATTIAFTAALGISVACNRAPETNAQPPVGPQPLLGVFAAQRIVVVPAGRVRAADSLGWVAQLGGARAAARHLDSAIAATLDARGLTARWILPVELKRAYDRNRTYATDPYQLVWEPVLSPRFKMGERYGEPLSSQLRTMIALQEDARFVLLPIELRFERETGRAAGRGVLRAALVDARTTEARWVADVRGDAANDRAAAIASVAARLADLFVSQ
jgi:hypothetical protein